MDEYYVYFLKDPDTNVVKYVGMTNRPESRLVNHLSNSRDAQRSKRLKASRRREWIKSLKDAGKEPALEIVTVCDSKSLASRIEIVATHMHADTVLNDMFGRRPPLLDGEQFIVVALMQHIRERLLWISRKARTHNYKHSHGQWMEKVNGISGDLKDLSHDVDAMLRNPSAR